MSDQRTNLQILDPGPLLPTLHRTTSADYSTTPPGLYLAADRITDHEPR
jgi:hypothetical protein